MRGTACTVGSDAVRMPFSFILLNMPLSADCSLDDSETGFRSDPGVRTARTQSLILPVSMTGAELSLQLL